MAQNAARSGRNAQNFLKHAVTISVKIGAAYPARPHPQQDPVLFELWDFYLFEPDISRSAEYGCLHDLLSHPWLNRGRGPFSSALIPRQPGH